MVVMVVFPTASARLAEAEPEATVVPLTFTVAVGSVVVGVTVIDEVAYGTEAV